MTGAAAGCGGDVVVRGAAAGDIPEIAEIEEASFSWPWSRDTLADVLDRSATEVLVATDRGAVVGYLVLVTGTGEAELANLAVRKDYRNRGVGEALLAHAAELLPGRGVNFLFLAVRASNHKAIRLYERFGFADIGAQDSYYRNPPEAARVLALELSGASPSAD